MAAGAVGRRVGASREDIGRGSSRGKEEQMSEKITRGGSVERSFKNKGTVKVQPLPLAPILLMQESAYAGEAGVTVAVGTCKRSLNRR